jgi:hypothetical protein
MGAAIDVLVEIPEDVRAQSSELAVLVGRIDRTLRQHTTSSGKKAAAKDDVAKARALAGKIWSLL